MSSTERVRKFRERNPGYDRRFMARQRAKVNEAFARMQAEAIAAAQVVAPAEPLMLPAPVADPMMAQLDGLAALRESQSPVELVPVVVGNAERLRRAVGMHNEGKSMRTSNIEHRTLNIQHRSEERRGELKGTREN